MQSNNVSGNIPIQISKLSNLSTLAWSLNNISGPIENLLDLPLLEYLYLDVNPINDKLPNNIDKLSFLKKISLGQSGIYGTIPETIGNITNLTTLALNTNNLSGTLPQSISKLSLVLFYTFDNPLLGGDVEHIFENMKNLTYLLIKNCNYTSRLPIFGSSRVVDLELSNNNFYGDIPDNWRNLTLITYLILKNNKISGGLEHILNLHNLNYLDISSNNFSGQVPIININLSYFSISNNNFIGFIPNKGNLVEYDVTYNPLLRAPKYAAMYAEPRYDIFTLHDKYICHPVKYFLTTIYCDPEFYYYKYCNCLDNNTKVVPQC